MSGAPNGESLSADEALLSAARTLRRMSAVLRRAALLAAGVLLAGCGTDETGGAGRVPGDTLSVVSLLALSGSEAPAAREFLRGQKLALAQAGGRVGDYDITMRALDDAPREEGQTRRAAAQAARLALSDTQAIAVVGPLDFESAQVAVPLLNAAGLLQISPTLGYGGFTRQFEDGEPERWYPSGRRTFHTGQADSEQAALTVAAIRAATGARRPRVAIEREADPEDLETESAIAGDEFAGEIVVVDDVARADAVVYAGDDVVAAEQIAGDLAREAPEALVVFGDDLTRAGLDRRLSGAARRRAVFVSRAPRPRSSPALRNFHRRYIRAFGAAPGPYAALGHAAMRSLLDGGIRRAGARANERDRVAEAYLESPPALPDPSAFRMRGERRVYLTLP